MEGGGKRLIGWVHPVERRKGGVDATRLSLEESENRSGWRGTKRKLGWREKEMARNKRNLAQKEK